MLAAAAAAAGLGAWKGGPWIREYFAHVSTDDAFVAGDASTVPSRIADVVERVLVHDNDYVERGTLLVRLDREPYQLLVEQKRLDWQQARLNVDRMVRALEAARADLEHGPRPRCGRRWRRSRRRGGPSRASRSRCATGSPACGPRPPRCGSAHADLILAQKDHERIKNLVAQQTGTPAELDQRLAALQGAREKVREAAERVQQARALLALPPDYNYPEQRPRRPRAQRRPTSAGPSPRVSRSWPSWGSRRRRPTSSPSRCTGRSRT